LPSSGHCVDQHETGIAGWSQAQTSTTVTHRPLQNEEGDGADAHDDEKGDAHDGDDPAHQNLLGQERFFGGSASAT
jgi:hypothetical protein